MHIVMNLLVQIFLGVALELVHCWWRVALVYLAGVLAGSMGTSIFSPRVFLAGASGGVYALITAHIATIIMVSISNVLLFAKMTNQIIPELGPNGVRHRAAVCVSRVLRNGSERFDLQQHLRSVR